MKKPEYNNLKKDLCPYCDSELNVNPECGRRKCSNNNCYFTMSRETISQMLNIPVEVCRYSLKNQTT